MTPSTNTRYVLDKLDWMRAEGIWPNGLRYLWTDAFDGYISYRLLDEKALSQEIAEMRLLIVQSAPGLQITQDLGLGMMLWMTQLDFDTFDRLFWTRAR